MHYRNKNVSKFDKDQTSWRKWATKETPLLLNMSWFKYDLLNLKIRNPANTHFSKNTHSRSSLRFSEPWRIFNTWWRWCLAAAVWLFSLFHPKSHKTDFSVCSKSTNEYKLALIARWQAFAVERETSHLFCIEGCIFYTLHGSQKCCAGLFCHACPFFFINKAKGNGSDYSTKRSRTEVLLSCNQSQHAPLHPHAVIWGSVPLHPRVLLLRQCQPVLWLICRHMLIVNISSLPLQWIPTWCFGSGWTCSINIIHLTGMDRDYFKVKATWLLVNELPLIDGPTDAIKTCSISRAKAVIRCWLELFLEVDKIYDCSFPCASDKLLWSKLHILNTSPPSLTPPLLTGSRWTYLRPAGHFTVSVYVSTLIDRKGVCVKPQTQWVQCR